MEEEVPLDIYALSYLAAKDYLVMVHTFDLLDWYDEEWWRAVDDYAAALRVYPESGWMEIYIQ